MTDAWYRRVLNGEAPGTAWTALLVHRSLVGSFLIETRAHEAPAKAGALAALREAGDGWSVTVFAEGRPVWTRRGEEGRWRRVR